MTVSKSYPEHEKLCRVKDDSQTIGLLLDWALGRYVEWCDDSRNYQYNSIEKLLALYFEIDLKKLAEEKDMMVEDLARLNRKRKDPVRSKKVSEGGNRGQGTRGHFRTKTN